MTKYKMWPGKYAWSPVVNLYMGLNGVKCMDEVLIMTPKVDKQYEAVAAQLVAVGMGLA